MLYAVISKWGGITYEFPKPIPLDKRLKDILEDTVDEKYYLSEEAVAQLVKEEE